MITARLFDAGTRPLITRQIVPGMDKVSWTEINHEEQQFEDRGDIMNREIIDTAPNELMIAPWPLALRYAAPCDYTERYEGLEFGLYQRMQALTDDANGWAEVPAGAAHVLGSPTLVRTQTHVQRRATVAEIQGGIVDDPTDWVRLPFGNEIGELPFSGTDLRDQALLRWDALQNCRYTLRLADNDLFMPFDLSQPDRYVFTVARSGEALDVTDFTRFGDRAQLNLYLRPRRWRYLVWTLAHFYMITPFEAFPNDEIFLRAFYDRPPYAPMRHDVHATAGVPIAWHEYYKAWLSYDPGIESKWLYSRAINDLRGEIFAQQYYTLCQAYIVIGIEPAVVTVWREASRGGDIVLGIGVGSPVQGMEQVIWVQERAAFPEYPRTLIDQFWCDFPLY